MNHRALCVLAVEWLKRAHSKGGPGCSIAMHEVSGHVSTEIVDAIGFRSRRPGGHGSTVVEVKVTRSDFLADRQKRHRACPDDGMGAFRYYMAPEGVIALSDLPAKWGLLEVDKNLRIRVRRGHVLERQLLEEWRFDARNVDAEISLLVAQLAKFGDPDCLSTQLRARREQFSWHS